MPSMVPYEKPGRSADIYQYTGKPQPNPMDYPTERMRDAVFAYWFFSKEVGDEPGMTIPEAYDYVGMPRGLSYQDTANVVKGAEQLGFLRLEGKKKRSTKKGKKRV